MRPSARYSFLALVACVAFAPIASTMTSLSVASLPLTYDAFVIPKLTAMGIFAAAALGLWALGADSVRWHRVGWAAVALAVIAAVSTLTGLDPAVSVFGRDAANGLVAWASYAAVFLLALQLLSGSGRLLSLSRAVLVSGALAATATLYQAAVMTTERVDALGLSEVGYLYGRGGGLFGNPDFVGAFLVLPFVLGVSLVLAERSGAWRAAAAASSLLMGAAIVVTQVRAAWIGVVVGLVLLAVVQLRRATPELRRNLLIVGVAILLALAAGLAIARPSLIIERLTIGDGATLDAVSSGRLSGWRDSLGVIAARPLTGTGPDAFTLGWYPTASALSDPNTGASSYFEDPHNVYLTVAATLGVPGLLAFVALLGISLAAGVATLRRTAEQSAGVRLHAGWLCGVGALLVTSVFAVTTIPTLLMIFVACAVLVAPQVRAADPARSNITAARVMAGLVAIFVAVASLIPLGADVQLANHMRTNTLEPLAAARAAAPWNKEIQTRYIDVRMADLTQRMQDGAPGVSEAVSAFDAELYALIERHPHELAYVLKRLDLLGRAAGQLGPTFGERALTVSRMAIVDFPELNDLRVYEARALNNLERYAEAIGVLEPLPRALTHDLALAESYLLAKRDEDGRALVREIDERYGEAPMARSFLSQPSIRPLLGE